VGVLAIRPHHSNAVPANQQALLEAFVSQIALVIEREFLDEAAERAAMLSESERLYSTLLNSISHELRTPIATIMGAAGNLIEPTARVDEAARQTLSHDIHEAAARLNRLVENLLDMSRLESGRLSLKREWCDVSDLIAVALDRMEPRFRNRVLRANVAPDLPLIQVDFVLMEQVLVNVLDNAATYTPEGTETCVSAQQQGEEIVITVADQGPGLLDTERVFQKFYREPGTTTGGTGLGLAIARGLVEAHGGSIRAENRATGGAQFEIRLPLETRPAVPMEIAQ
jgi:two-component system sensor histidine kinase KdpD